MSAPSPITAASAHLVKSPFSQNVHYINAQGRPNVAMTDAIEDMKEVLRDRHRIHHLPAVVVQGRYDMVCPPLGAWTLAQGWARAELRMIPASGHALTEPRIAAELVRVMQAMAGLD